MSSIPGTSVYLPHAGLDPSRTQVGFDPSQPGRDPGLDAATEVRAPVGEPAASTDSGDAILQAQAWTTDGPRYFNSEPGIGSQFKSLSLVEATSQAPDAIAAPLDQPFADAA